MRYQGINEWPGGAGTRCPDRAAGMESRQRQAGGIEGASGHLARWEGGRPSLPRRCGQAPGMVRGQTRSHRFHRSSGQVHGGRSPGRRGRLPRLNGSSCSAGRSHLKHRRPVTRQPSPPTNGLALPPWNPVMPRRAGPSPAIRRPAAGRRREQPANQPAEPGPPAAPRPAGSSSRQPACRRAPGRPHGANPAAGRGSSGRARPRRRRPATARHPATEPGSRPPPPDRKSMGTKAPWRRAGRRWRQPDVSSQQV